MRALLLLLTACWTAPSSAPAPAPESQPPPAKAPLQHEAPAIAEAAPVAGRSVWRGTYRCAQGVTAVQLTIEGSAAGGADVIFDFGPHAGNPNLPPGSYRLTGALEDRGTHLELRVVPDKWILQPANYVMVGFEARTTDPGRRKMSGTIDEPACGGIDVVRVD